MADYKDLLCRCTSCGQRFTVHTVPQTSAYADADWVCPHCGGRAIDDVPLPDEVFLVLANRNSSPNAAKSPHLRYFLYKDDAQAALGEIEPEIRGYFGLYRAFLYIKERVA